jgi:hypothetical protein
MHWHCSTHEAAMTAFPHGYALLIGVGAHTNPAHALPTTVHDARALATLLSDPLRCAYPPDQIRLLHDESATRQGILDGLAWLKMCAEQDPAATIVVYYSGHGYALPQQHAYWLITYDAMDTASALTAADFTAALRAIPAERLLVLLDCCRAEGMATSKHPGEQPLPITPTQPDAALVSTLTQGNGRAVCTSSRGTQLSYIRAEQDLSIFTYHLLEALRGAANQAGQTVVRLSHVMQYLGDMVPKSAGAVGRDQTPFFDFKTEDFAIAAIAGGTALAEDGWYHQLDTLPVDSVPAVATLPAVARMPYAPNPHFVGRDEVLVELAKALKGGGRVALGPRAAATGLGGIGKTSVAAEFVHRYGQYFAGGVFWLSFAEPSAIPGEVALCGGAGGLNSICIPPLSSSRSTSRCTLSGKPGSRRCRACSCSITAKIRRSCRTGRP